MEKYLNLLSIISFFVSIIAMFSSYWFWKNPLDKEIKNVKKFEDDDGRVCYVTGYICKKWVATKIIISDVNKSKEFKYIASKKNNPKIKEAPGNLEELRGLNYELEK